MVQGFLSSMVTQEPRFLITFHSALLRVWPPSQCSWLLEFQLSCLHSGQKEKEKVGYTWTCAGSGRCWTTSPGPRLLAICVHNSMHIINITYQPHCSISLLSWGHRRLLNHKQEQPVSVGEFRVISTRGVQGVPAYLSSSEMVVRHIPHSSSEVPKWH